ncbi:hypothetical protein RA262_27690, partial [Pseudomonas syringae pv. tagetis]
MSGVGVVLFGGWLVCWVVWGWLVVDGRSWWLWCCVGGVLWVVGFLWLVGGFVVFFFGCVVWGVFGLFLFGVFVVRAAIEVW